MSFWKKKIKENIEIGLISLFYYNLYFKYGPVQSTKAGPNMALSTTQWAGPTNPHELTSSPSLLAFLFVQLLDNHQTLSVWQHEYVIS